MHLTTAPLLHRVLTFGKSQRYANVLGAIMSVAWLVGFIIHATMDEFLLHAVSFAVSVYIIGIKTSRLLSERVRNPVYRAKAQGMARFGVCKCATAEFQRKLFVRSVLMMQTSGCLLWLHCLADRSLGLRQPDQDERGCWPPLGFPIRATWMV